MDWKQYTPNTLYAITCEILHNSRKNCPDINFFKDRVSWLQEELDFEMEKLKSAAIAGTVKRVDQVSF